jgi:hypothetical protein
MLEVGCAKGPNGEQDVGLTLAETRTHFAAWAIMSSPLFLSHDVTNETVMEEVWPIISNTDIIAINQAWAGFSGGPFWLSLGKLQSSFSFVPVRNMCEKYTCPKLPAQTHQYLVPFCSYFTRVCICTSRWKGSKQLPLQKWIDTQGLQFY